jgi:hypothetical protein
MAALVVLAVAGLVVAFAVERVLHALCVVAWHVLQGTTTSLRTYAALAVVLNISQATADVVLSAVSVSVAAGAALAGVASWIVRLTVVGLLLAAAFEYYPSLVEDTVVFWNSGFGSGLRAVWVMPAWYVYRLAAIVLPLYNAIVYIPVKLLTVVLLPGLEVDPAAFFGLLAEFFEFVHHLCESVVAYLVSFRSCSGDEFDASCLEAGRRMLDVVTPMSDVRLMVGHAVHIVRLNCHALAAPVDLALYQFMDINFVKAVHNLVNVPLLAVLQVPAITVERCRRSAGEEGGLSVLMCVPDFEPVWNALSSGLRFLGRGVDNWLNIAALIIEEAITGTGPSCAAPPLASEVAAPERGLFGANETIVVGLTPGMFATTDGWSTRYTVFWTSVHHMDVSRSWPLAVDVRHGLAAVQYTDADEMDDSGHATTAMLGCRCRDVEDGASPSGARLAITCAISPYGAEAYDTMHLRQDEYILPVEFQLPSAAYDLRCAQVDLAVQSVRWPLSRLARPDPAGVPRDANDPLLDGGALQGPRELDAALYVTPRCTFSSAAAGPDLACLESFTRAGCFPYCIAGRVRGSMNGALVLYDADDWESHVQLLARDCGLGRVSVARDEAGAFVDNGFDVETGPVPAGYGARFDVRGTDVPGVAVARNATAGACVYDATIATRVRRETLPAYDDLQAVLLPEQPFVVAGDASLFVQWEGRDDGDPDNDRAVIRVKRLFGSEASQFTLVTMPTAIPTLGVCATAADCGTPGQSLVTLPWAYSRSPGLAAPAVATKWSVLYAVNPSPDVYRAFFDWCVRPAESTRTQFQITSAYGPIRIWRVDAFVEAGALAAQVARDDVGLAIPAFDGDVSYDSCAQPRNLSVTSLMYIDEYNVAVTLLRASPRYYDVETKRPVPDAPAGGGEVSFDVYYLNPRTMRLRRHALWQEDTPVSTLAQGYLCPALRRVPPLGGLLAETLVVAASLVRFPVSVLTYLPALAPANLRHLRECPRVTRGHAILRECGTSLLSLAYLWEALLRGNTFFWMSFADVAQLFSGTPAADLTRTLLNGVAATGVHGYNVVAYGTAERLNAMLVNRAPPLVRGAFSAVAGSFALVRFAYEALSTLFVEFLAAGGLSSPVAVVEPLWGALYGLRLRYEEIVTTPGLQVCTGVGLMLGWSNPFARLARDVCVQNVLLVPTVLRLGTVFFVHHPVLHCMCRMPAGVDVQAHAAGVCLARAPLAYRPLLAEVIERGAPQVRGMCVEMAAVANDALAHAPDLLFSVAYDIAADVQDLLNYLVTVFDGSGGACTDFYSNPYVMVLMPYPVDYFRTCGGTASCRLRCADHFGAFEASRARAETGPRRTIHDTTLVEHPFLSEEDILQRRNRPPFDVLGLVEHTACEAVCGAPARCFSVAGVDAAERLAVEAFCLPHAPGTSLRGAPGAAWAVADSDAWTPRLLEVRFLSLAPDARVLLALRADGLFLCTPAGVLRRVVGLLGRETFYSWSAEAMHAIEHVYVLPARAPGEDAAVVVYGSVRHRSVDDGVRTEALCVSADVELGALSATGGVHFFPVCEAGENLREVVGDREIVLSADLAHAVLVPTSSREEVLYCTLDGRRFRVGACAALGAQDGLLFDAATLLSSFRSPVAEMFTLSREGVSMRRQEVVSQSSVLSFGLDGGDRVVTFFKTAHGADAPVWVADVRVVVAADAASIRSLEERRSSSQEVALVIERECSVTSCSGCASVTTRKLCYAAQQCAIARCIGTVVHMNRPTCMFGILLKDLVETRVQDSVALWGAFAEVMQLVVDASTGVLQPNVAVNFPHDAVDSFVCEVKDVIVGLFGAVLSVVNSAAVTFADIAPAEGAVNEVVVLATQVSASLTNFFAHIAYGILYAWFASYQTFFCTTNGALAIFDVTGASIRLLPSAGEEGWDAVGGQCVTKLAGESLAEFGAGSDSRSTVVGVIDDMTETLSRISSSFPMETLVHQLDAGITWAIGVVRAFQDLLQAVDVDGCRLADLSMGLAGTCACGDAPAAIPADVAAHGFVDSAFWCVGTLRMTMPDGSAKIVFNPHSLADLRAAAAPTIDDYLDCISGGPQLSGEACYELEPHDPRGFLERQGVTLLAVLARCRGNYANKQWDDGAAFVFNTSLSPDLGELGPVIETLFPVSMYPYPDVGACLLRTLGEGTGTDACLDLFLRHVDVPRGEYFAYGAARGGAGVLDTDACEVFTGPAAAGRAAFTPCVDERADETTACDLPYFLWTGRSANRIPVASAHVKIPADGDRDRFDTAAGRVTLARQRVLAALDGFLDGDEAWSAEGLAVSLFTSEGDALHQALDCLVLGPYGSTDLWPAGGALPGARFSRRPDGGPGREFELPCSGGSLQGDRVLPFTCGSPARRALMKYFLRDYYPAQGGDLAGIIRNATLEFFRELRDVWADHERFGCPCAGDAPPSLRCCSAEDTAGWAAFLDGTARQKELSGSQLTAELLDDLAAFLATDFVTDTHEVLTRHAPPGAYDWTEEQRLLAADLGLFDTRHPVVTYGPEEAAWPLRDNSSLLDFCVAQLAGVASTLPLPGGVPTTVRFDPTAGSPGAYLSALEDYVRTVTRRAERQSPLFWHHVLRHVPSDSQMCLDATAPAPAPGDLPLTPLPDDGRLAGDHFATLRANLARMLEDMAEKGGTATETVAAAPPALRRLGAWAHSFATLDERCVCGWADAGGCLVPAAVCLVAATDALRAACDAAAGGPVRYAPAELFWDVHLAAAAAGDAVACDDLAPSDAWGVLPDGDAWVESGAPPPAALPLLDVATGGRGGLRLGNLLQLRDHWRQLLSPAARHRPLVHAGERGTSAARKWCASSFTARVSRADLLDRYVDELFPVAQGVRGALPVETCTRYALELARHALADAAGLPEARVLAQGVEVWRRRCRAQVDAVATCATRGVYDATPATRDRADCPFTVSDLLPGSATAYVAPSCLVRVDGAFHDPCLCGDCVGATYTLAQVRACPLPVDARELAAHAAWGGSWRWPADAPADVVARFVAHEQAGGVPHALRGAALLARVFDAPAPGLFNAEGAWATAEGLAGAATRHCDSVVDWWPEEWDEPVGFHVTTPPFADEAAYRVFDNAFAIERLPDGSVRVRYEHRYLRNETLARNHFGAAGLCGTHSYGVAMREVNTMRACTRLSRHDRADPTVPVRSHATDAANEETFHDEACAETYELPLDPAGDFDAARWAGLVGGWPDFSAADWPRGTAETAPARRELGADCPLPELASCETDADCVGRALLAEAAPLRCLHHVCVVAAQRGGVFECARHADCAGGRLCSGLGACVPPVLQFSNGRPQEVEAQVFAEACAGDAQSMVGASPWDAVPGLLPDSGLCSYRAWFEQRDLLERAGCSAPGACRVDARETAVRHSGVSGGVNRGTLWDEQRLRVAAHACDRDYMHVAGLAACTPPAGVCRTAAGLPCEFARGSLTRTHDTNGTLALHVSPAFHAAPHGFLGLTEPFAELYDVPNRESRLRFCSEIPQCSLPPFTMNGFVLRERRRVAIAAPGDRGLYAPIGYDDYFLCGAFGFLVGTVGGVPKCRLDPAVTPLHHALCAPAALPACPWSFTPPHTRERVCLAPEYDGTPAAVAAMAEHLDWQLTGAIRTGFATLAEYRALCSCADEIWARYAAEPLLQGPRLAVWQSEDDDLQRETGPEWLYFFDEEAPHAATELPFAWWVKCTLLSGIAPAHDAVVHCPAWSSRTSRVADTLGATVTDALRRLDGAITERWWAENVATGAADVDEETCLGGAFENEQYLSEMAFRFREHVLQSLDVDLAASLAETCFEAQEHDVERLATDRTWMSALSRLYTFGDPGGILPEYLVSRRPRTVPVDDLAGHRVWGELCRHWFGDGWFEAFPDVLARRVEHPDGIPAGRFTNFADDRFDRLRAVLDAVRVAERCDRVLAEGAEADAFCIFRHEPFLDPLVFTRFVRDSDPPRPLILMRRDQDPANTLQFFADPGRRFGEQGGVVFRDLCEDQQPPDTALAPLSRRVADGPARRLLVIYGSPGYVTAGDVANRVNEEKRKSQESSTDTVVPPVSPPTERELFFEVVANLERVASLPFGCANLLRASFDKDPVLRSVLDSEDWGGQDLIDWCDNVIAVNNARETGEVFADPSRDPGGPSCSLALDSAPDRCDARWEMHYRYAGGLDPGMRCSADGAFLFSQGHKPVVDNPAGDVCWSANTTCLSQQLRLARRLRLPPGVRFWAYRDTSGDVAPREVWRKLFTVRDASGAPTLVDSQIVPAFAFCPTDDVPKSKWAWREDAFSGDIEYDVKVFATNAGAALTQADTVVALDAPVFALRLALHPETACCVDNCTGVCERLGLPGRVAVEVRKRLYQCAECTRGFRLYCEGRHGCTHAPLAGLSGAQEAFLRANGVPFDRPMSYETLVRAVHLLAREFLLRTEGLDGTFRVAPQTAPYYAATNIDAFAYFDSTNARNYIRSLTDGLTGGIGECASSTSADDSVDYEKCATDEYLREFAAFVRENYRHAAFVRVPPGGTAAWAADAAQFLARSVLAYADHARPLRQRFVEWLLDFDRHCEAGSLYDSVCLRDGNRFRLLNPWVGGDFNPIDFCDTPFDPEEEQRIIDVFCNKPTCPGYYAGNKSADRFYDAIPAACDAGRGGAPTRLLPRASVATSLCSKAPEPAAVCRHAQGALGGVLDPGGVAVDGDGVDDLYAETPREALAAVGGLLAPPRNRLFEGVGRHEAAYAGITPLALSPDDIGGTHLHLRVGADGALRVHDVLLGHPPDTASPSFVADSLSARAPDLAWLANFEAVLAVEHAAAEARTPAAAAGAPPAWDCPYRRLRHWGDAPAATPDPRRAAVMFEELTGGRLVHPLQAAGTGNVARLRTGNGWCFCGGAGGDCARPLGDTSACGLLQAIRSTYDEGWRRGAAAGGSVCYDQTDWPYAAGALRDGSALPAGRVRPNCSLFERLPPFEYRLKNVPFRPAAPQTTSAPGGDCHMGRGTQWVDTAGVRCRLEGQNDTHTILRCADGATRAPARERARPLGEVMAAARTARRRCAAASAPPMFVSGRGGPMPAASSFGLHARVSAERFLAADLARRVCGAAACSGPGWEAGGFLATLLSDPGALLDAPAQAPRAPRARLAEDTGPADDALWDRPWVFCPRNASCAGTIPRATWLDPAARPGACADALRDHAPASLSLNVTLCDLDGRTDALCATLAAAERDISEAHCLAAGACLSEAFYYHPATFSRTNEQFVRETVEDFYLRVDAGACPQAAAEVAAQLRHNTANRDKCDSVWLEGVVVLLQGLRTVLHAVVRVLYYAAMMILTFFRFLRLGAFNFQEILQDLLYYFEQLMQEALDLLRAAAELVWRAILESPSGKKFYDLMLKVCDVVTTIINFFKDVYCYQLHGLMQGIREIQKGLKAVPLTSWMIKKQDEDNVEDAIAAFETCLDEDLECTLKYGFGAQLNPALATPTRCWAQYVTSLGDPASLSCTAADTCVRELGDTAAPGDENIVCDACPAAPEGVSAFGCDPLRKVCACGVVQRERTPCLDHLQCHVQDDAVCTFTNSKAETSFGTIGCRECETRRPRCIRGAGEETGYCTCMLAPLEDESCSAVGAAVFPSGRGLCLAATGAVAAALQTGTGFVAEYSRLLSIPCVTADLGDTFCFEVQYSAFQTLRRVVALDILRVGIPPGPFRRLLGAGEAAAARLLDAPWDDATGVCGELVRAWRAASDSLRPLETERLHECLRWRRVAQDTIARHNLSAVDDRFLLSAADFAATVSRFDALRALVARPQWLVDVALHTAAARPLLAVAELVERWAAADHPAAPWATFLAALGAGDLEGWAPSHPADAPAAPRRHATRHLLADGALAAPVARVTPPAARRLREWREGLDAVTQYSLKVTLSGDATQELPPDLAAEWVDGPFRWPPVYSYWEDGNASCVVGALMADVVAHAFDAAVRVYRNTSPPAAVPTRSFRASALSVPPRADLPPADELRAEHADLLVDATYRLLDALDAVGFERSWFAGLFAAIPATVDDFLTCDFEEAMFCTNYHRTVWNSFWWVVIYSSITLFALQFTQFPFQRTILFLIFWPLVIFYSTGVSLLCAPMIPPCVLDEGIQILDSLLPTKLHIPNALQTYPGCIDDAAQSMRPPEIAPNASCLVSCRAEPHGFSRWEAPVAWWYCDFDAAHCLHARDWLAHHGVLYTETLRRFLTQKARIATEGDADLVAAQRFCAAITTWYVAPWVVVGVVALYGAAWVALVAAALARGALSVALQALLMTHVNERDRRQWRNIFIVRLLRERRE